MNTESVSHATPTGLIDPDTTTSIAPQAVIKNAVAAYLYMYPLVVFGVSYEALINVEKPTWETLSAPLNQFMSVRQSRPENHGVIMTSTDTLYTLAWVTRYQLLASSRMRFFVLMIAPFGS
jgi:hypothetical protein